MSDEWPYFWRRISIIACEDIGQGDLELTKFVIACSKVFTPSKAKSVLPIICRFLLSEMASAPSKSRTACSLAGIDAARKTGSLVGPLTGAEYTILGALEQRDHALNEAVSTWRVWQRQNDWRGARLLRYVDLSLPFQAQQVRFIGPTHETLCGLPSFSYDMYSRIGRMVLRRLVHGTTGVFGVRDFFRCVSVADPVNAAGEALFFCEGGLLRGEVVYEPVIRLRHKTLAAQFGLTDALWDELRRIVAEAARSGLVDQLRVEELDRRSAQGRLFDE